MVLSASPRRMFAKKSADSQCGSFSPSFRRACQTVFDGQNALIFCFPPRQTKIRRANSEAPLPAGANSVASAHRQRPLPAGQGSVISPPVRSFLPRKSVKGNTSTFPLHILPPEKMAEQRTIGKNKRQTSVFNTGAAIPCSAGAMGRRAPSGPAGSAGFQSLWLRADAPMPHEQEAWALRFVPVRTAMGADGGRPTSRSLPPAFSDAGKGPAGSAIFQRLRLPGNTPTRGGCRLRQAFPVHPQPPRRVFVRGIAGQGKKSV